MARGDFPTANSRKIRPTIAASASLILRSPRTGSPSLSVRKRFRIWLAQFPLVFSRANDFESHWDYFLEGSIRNHMGDIFALPEGMQALNEGRYFVADDDNEYVVETVVKSLRLRGITFT